MPDARTLTPLPFKQPAPRLPPPDLRHASGYQVLCPAGVRLLLRRYQTRGILARDLSADTACDYHKLLDTLDYMRDRREVLEIEPGRWALNFAVTG